MRRVILGLLGGFLLQGAGGAPELLPQNVVNAADYSGGRVAPGEILVLFPSNAGPETLIGTQMDATGRVATVLGETRVWFDGIAAPMSYAMRGQVSAVVPYEVAGRPTTEIVVEYRGRRSAPMMLPVILSAPALFTLDS